MPLLDWLNKPASLQTARRVPYRLLEAVPELGYGAAPNHNLLIQADNLEAREALLPLYSGRIKCIYIDLRFWGREQPQRWRTKWVDTTSAWKWAITP